MTGGKTETYGYLDSTELLWPGSDSVWEEISSARLPRHLSGVRITNVDNRGLLLGAWSISLDLYSSSHWPVCVIGGQDGEDHHEHESILELTDSLT